MVITVTCNGHSFTDIQGIFLDKDGTLANVAHYLNQLGHTHAQLLESQLPGTYNLTLKALGLTEHGVNPSGLLAVGSRPDTIVGTAAAIAIKGCPWIKALTLSKKTLTTADQKYLPKEHFTPLLPGVLDFLQRLKQAKLKVIMVSADYQKNLESFVSYYELQAYFDKLQGVSSQHSDKTEPSFLQAACHNLGIEPHQGLVIGDAASDFRMAKSAKGFIGFLGGWSPPLCETDILSEDTDKSSIALSHYTFAKDFSEIKLMQIPD
ncbi:MAG: HAD family hydrolase [Leptolyngbya sp. SIO3F4]|nr:HAD family hydrolase [Leptolyngbya sp. SIO3F4]